MKNKTNMNTQKRNLALSNIIAILLILFFLGAIIIGIIKYKEFYSLQGFQGIANPRPYIFMIIVGGGLFILFPAVVLIKTNKAVRKAKKTTINENKMIDSKKAFTYYRDLPNNYGIGVNTLLTDNTLENYKDIVAVVLDLCARKYLYLSKNNNKYIIKVLKGIDDNLLSNEKYILSLVLNNEIKNINYKEWFNYCYADGKSLDLFEQAQIEHTKFNTPLNGEDFGKGAKKIALISLIISLFFIFNPLVAIAIFVFLFIIMFIVFYIYMIGKGLNNVATMSARAGYEQEMKNQLIRTDKGRKELEKVFAFNAFIKDFSRFTEKHVEEVHLWDRYLSYAQVFGLTKEIMKSGYDKLINNSSFVIDDFDNITLDNIVKEN